MHALLVAVLLGANPSVLEEKPEKPWERLTHEERHMGVLVRFTLYAQDKAIANKAAREAFDRIAEIDRMMSDYNPESELRRLCDNAKPGEAVKVSEELFFVLKESQRLAEKSNGAFDVTVGPVVRLWRRARRQNEMPDAERLKEALNAVGYPKVKLDKKARTVTLTHPGMRLDLGGIAKGYAGDAALAVFKKHNLPRVMIAVSGDLVMGDAPPGKAGWRVGLAPLEKVDGPPSRILELKNAAVSTSGDAFQFVEIKGKRYSHIVDPKTGLGLTQRSSVTVIAPTGSEADSLASAVSVLGPEAGLKLIESTPKTAALIVQGEPQKTYESKGFDKHNASPSALPDDAKETDLKKIE
jgi:thiamine biosynthesis lipoprotein